MLKGEMLNSSVRRSLKHVRGRLENFHSFAIGRNGDTTAGMYKAESNAGGLRETIAGHSDLSFGSVCE